MHDLADEQLMLNYQKGEVSAMDEILRRYKNPIYQFSCRLIQDASEAQDITQEVFLRLHQHKEDYRPSGKFSTWIFSIAHNLCISNLRSKKRFCIWPRRDDESNELVEFASSDPSVQEAVSDNELSKLVKESIQGLPFLQKEALILREYQNLDYQEIAKILKKSLGTVKTLIHRARMNLKVKLSPYLEEARST
ncbi:MAG: RNA polymerase sigma factor [Candidatus Omnitrophota bacterium]